MEATDGRGAGAASGGRQLLGAPENVPVALFLPAESRFQPGPRCRTLSVPRTQRTATCPSETSGAPHPHTRTPGRQRAAPTAAPAARCPPTRRAAPVKLPLVLSHALGPPAQAGCRSPPLPPSVPVWEKLTEATLPCVLSLDCSIQEPLTPARCTYAPLPTSHSPSGPCGLPQVPPVPSAAGRGRRCPRPGSTLLEPLWVGAQYRASLPFPLFSLSPRLAAELYIRCAKCI